MKKRRCIRLRLTLPVCILALGCSILKITARRSSMVLRDIPESDERLTRVRKGDEPLFLPEYKSLKEWKARVESLRPHILASCGLSPLPERCPLNGEIFHRREHHWFSTEKVYFEALPGFFVTGNLYRPLEGEGPFPAVLCPHGHWPGGRLENSLKGSVPARCAHFARMGCVVLSYDMIGYHDSRQLEHRFGSEEQSLWGFSPMGLQLWNSIRCLDFLCRLPDVDPERIGVTGASGGGTQTFMLMAVDERVSVAAPVNMVSAHFQGGCICENAPGLRLDTTNVEIAAMMAPRPLLLVGATGDWTRNLLEVEAPWVADIYKMYGALDHFHAGRFEADHNYNADTRQFVYDWFERWLLPPHAGGLRTEGPLPQLAESALRVFPEGHPLPGRAVSAEDLFGFWVRSAEGRIEEFRPESPKEFRALRQTYGVPLKHVLNVEVPQNGEVWESGIKESSHEGFLWRDLVIGRVERGDRVPATVLEPTRQHRNAALLFLSPRGRECLKREGTPYPRRDAFNPACEGTLVMSIDCLLTGEGEGGTFPGADVKHFTTFNRTLTQQRIQDVLTALAYLKKERGMGKVKVIAEQEAAAWAIWAGALSMDVDELELDFGDFTLQNDRDWVRDLYIPTIRRAGGLSVAAGLFAPRPLRLKGSEPPLDMGYLEDCYRAARATRRLSLDL